jgi:tRNA threonylcarbamoyl adenosine modification protein (Sua5/YciO/YrdC/YwlC family)
MQRWRIAEAPAAAELDAIAALLLAGGIVLLPTDTIYGLHAVAMNERAIDRLANAKGRDDAKPFVVIASSIEQLEEIGIDFQADIRTSLESIWPAPLTAVLPLRFPVGASRGARTLAVRIPAVPWLRELAAKCGPLASTSANRSGNPPVSVPAELAREVLEHVDGIVDAGSSTGEPSTIVDFTQSPPALLREGDPAFTQKLWKTLRKSL